MSRFLCLYFEDFPVWALLEANPQLAHRLVLMHAGQRVIAASSAAKRAGVQAGVSLTSARSLLPQATLVAHDMAQTELAWQEVLQTLSTYTPQIESLRPGVAMLDATPLFAVRPPAKNGSAALTLSFSRLLQQWGIHAGLATDRATAEIAAYNSIAGTIRTVRGGRNVSYLNSVPVEVLRQAEVGGNTIERLQDFGFGYIGQLRWFAPRLLQEHFPEGNVLHRYALAGTRDADERAVAAYQPVPAVQACHVFEEVACEAEQWEPALESLVQQVCSQLDGRTAAALSFTVEESSGCVTQRRVLPSTMTTDSATENLERIVAAQMLAFLASLRGTSPAIYSITLKLISVTAPVQTSDAPEEVQNHTPRSSLLQTLHLLETHLPQAWQRLPWQHLPWQHLPWQRRQPQPLQLVTEHDCPLQRSEKWVVNEVA